MFIFFPLRDEYRVRKFPVVVLSIITVNVFIFLLNAFNPEYNQVVSKYGFTPSRLSPVTLLTSMFLHGGLAHLGFNMWYLWLFGDNIEDRWGRFPFLVFYLSAGIFSMLLYSILISEGMRNIPTIGASGAIAGVLGAYAVLFPKSRITFKYFLWILLFIMRFGEFKIYAGVWLGFWFIQQGVFTLIAAKSMSASSVAFGAHFAGFIYGLAVGIGTKIYREVKFREHVQQGKNVLFNLLGTKQYMPRTIEESGEIEKAKSSISSHIEEDRVSAAKIYSSLTDKYPEVTLPEKTQYIIAESLYRQEDKDKAFIAYKNFILSYTFSKLADKALFAIGKILTEKEEYQKAKYAFLQIVLFYPYSELYEEAKYYLEKHLPRATSQNSRQDNTHPFYYN